MKSWQNVWDQIGVPKTQNPSVTSCRTGAPLFVLVRYFAIALVDVAVYGRKLHTNRRHEGRPHKQVEVNIRVFLVFIIAPNGALYTGNFSGKSFTSSRGTMALKAFI